ncbi:uncharacterized protein EHS24_001827 [Apiotrichum porosum]|uniref:t-SNARE coiled-coil homology domain-containing protein n=1 Tax=Apiotrichum porosum TaxID=105984 RepID=A0A427XJG9_9TREE|nr:uncharacterized protein EHS24_001827 [Apiotrichum porosum]RSH78904.1 hypothetical protein EHS24_001827 [Apiotrichum porosum]
MSRDPYLDAKGEVETNIQNVNNLLGSHSRISGASDPSAIAETIEELQATLNLLETDLQDLEDCVQVVEGHGDRWGIEASEVRQRRSFVDRVTRDVERLRSRVRDVVGKGKKRHQQAFQASDIENQRASSDAEEVERWEREEQQVGLSTVKTLTAGLIGQEVAEHSEMLDDLSTGVDNTQSRLSRVSRTMQEFIRKNEARGALSF